MKGFVITIVIFLGGVWSVLLLSVLLEFGCYVLFVVVYLDDSFVDWDVGLTVGSILRDTGVLSILKIFNNILWCLIYYDDLMKFN